MEQANKNRWIKALESGQYVEKPMDIPPRRIKDTYDAIGVLMDINQHLGYSWSVKNDKYTIDSYINKDKDILWSDIGSTYSFMDGMLGNFKGAFTFKQAIEYLKNG